MRLDITFRFHPHKLYRDAIAREHGMIVDDASAQKQLLAKHSYGINARIGAAR